MTAGRFLLWMLLGKSYPFCTPSVTRPQEDNLPRPPGFATSSGQADGTLPCRTSPFGSVFHPLLYPVEKREMTQLGTGKSETHIGFASFLNEPVSKDRFALSVPCPFPPHPSLPPKDKCVIKQPTASRSAS